MVLPTGWGEWGVVTEHNTKHLYVPEYSIEIYIGRKKSAFSHPTLDRVWWVCQMRSLFLQSCVGGASSSISPLHKSLQHHDRSSDPNLAFICEVAAPNICLLLSHFRCQFRGVLIFVLLRPLFSRQRGTFLRCLHFTVLFLMKSESTIARVWGKRDRKRDPQKWTEVVGGRWTVGFSYKY